MRFYKLEFSGGNLSNNVTVSSQVNGQNDPNALDIEIDVPLYSGSDPSGYPFIRLWGVPVEAIGQGADLVNANLAVTVGMAKGLPLANPAQQGQIIKSKIWQCFGNFVGTDQTLDLVVVPAWTPSPTAPGLPPPPVNLVLNWQQGQPLGDAIQQALSTAYPGTDIKVAVSDKLVFSGGGPTMLSFHHDAGDFAEYLRQVSHSIITDPSYLGVQLVSNGASIQVFDGTQTGSGGPKQIAFADLVGQPTWIAYKQVQFSCVMRGDIFIGDQIQFPKVPTVASAAQTQQQAKDRASFNTGTFMVTYIRHVGRFRDANGQSWITTFNAVSTATD